MISQLLQLDCEVEGKLDYKERNYLAHTTHAQGGLIQLIKSVQSENALRQLVK